MTKRICGIIVLLLFTFTIISEAQVNATLAECEQAFIKNNLLLLAEKYNIDVAKANVIQAKIWELPVAAAEFNAINPQDGRVLDVGKRGQKALAVSQLIYLGKKKQNEVAFAKSNVAVAELQYEQLIRNLRYQLHQSFYTIYFEQQKIQRINGQVGNLDALLTAYNTQAQKGNVAMRDVVRLQSLMLSLKNDVIDIQKNINTEQSNIRILTGFDNNIIPNVVENEIASILNKKDIPSSENLFQTALSKNPDYLAFQKIIESQSLFLQWQKSLATPDLNAGLSYDQRGGAFGNQINFTVAMPIPLWNKNKGNIEAAALQQHQTAALQNQKKIEIQQNIENQYITWQQQHAQYDLINDKSIQNFDDVYTGVLANFQKRNISLLEFTDFMESYSQSILQYNEMKKQLLLTCEALNYVVNEKLF